MISMWRERSWIISDEVFRKQCQDTGRLGIRGDLAGGNKRWRGGESGGLCRCSLRKGLIQNVPLGPNGPTLNFTQGARFGLSRPSLPLFLLLIFFSSNDLLDQIYI